MRFCETVAGDPMSPLTPGKSLILCVWSVTGDDADMIAASFVFYEERGVDVVLHMKS